MYWFVFYCIILYRIVLYCIEGVRLMAHADEVIKGISLVETQLPQGERPALDAKEGTTNEGLLSKRLRMVYHRDRVSQRRVELAGSVVKLTTLWDQFGLRREKTASTVAVLLQQQQQQQLELTNSSKSHTDHNHNHSKDKDKDDVNTNGSSNKEPNDITVTRLQLLESKVQLMLSSMNHEFDVVEKEVGVREEELTKELGELEGVLCEVEGVVIGGVGVGAGGAAGGSIKQEGNVRGVHDHDNGQDNGHEEQKQRSASVSVSKLSSKGQSNGSVKVDRAQLNAQSNATQSNNLSIPQSPAQSPTHYNPPVSPSVVASPSLTLTTERSHLTHSTAHHQLKREKKAQKIALKNAQKKTEKMKFVHSKRLNRVLGGIVPPGGKESKEDNTGIGAYRVNFERSQVSVLFSSLPYISCPPNTRDILVSLPSAIPLMYTSPVSTTTIILLPLLLSSCRSRI